MDEEEKYWSNLEKLYVHNVYESISSKYDEFLKLSQIRYYNKIYGKDCDQSNQAFKISKLIPKNGYKINQKKYNEWPKVRHFLLQIEPYSLVADVGCGDGKYLNVNNHILSIGSDRSTSLCQLASFKNCSNSNVCNKNQIIICDNLHLPFRSNLFDAVISIGVIHHLSTQKRRIKAIKELTRILKPGGKMMIYVWALEQRLRKFNSQDVLVPMLNTNKSEINFSLRRDLSNNSAANSEDSNDESFSDKTLSSSLINESNIFSIKTNKENIETLDESFENYKSDNQLNIEQKKLSDIKFDINSNENSSSDMNKLETNQIKADLENKTDKNCNIVDNFKRFLSQKFTFNNKNNNNNSFKLKNYSSSISLSCSIPNAQNLDKNSDIFLNSSLKSSSSIERYRRIIEDHKDLLPENFTIRQFPYSSCQDTFEANENKFNKCDFDSTTSSSLSPSPINQSSPSEPNFNQENLNEEKASNSSDLEINSTTNTEQNEQDQSEELDLNNSLNKRFYHVFKKNELDNLINEYCPDLIIYQSYYDHGNWGVCVEKKTN